LRPAQCVQEGRRLFSDPGSRSRRGVKNGTRIGDVGFFGGSNEQNGDGSYEETLSCERKRWNLHLQLLYLGHRQCQSSKFGHSRQSAISNGESIDRQALYASIVCQPQVRSVFSSPPSSSHHFSSLVLIFLRVLIRRFSVDAHNAGEVALLPWLRRISEFFHSPASATRSISRGYPLCSLIFHLF